MNLPTFRTDVAGIRALLGIALCCGGLQAATLLTATPARVSLSCDTVAGVGPAAAIVVKPVAPLAGSASIAVSLGPLPVGMVASRPALQILTAANQAEGLTYTVNLLPGCGGAATSSITIRFYAAGISDASAIAGTVVTAAASSLAASPITLTCLRNAGPPVSYTAGPSVTASVTSAAVGGTPFTVDPAANPAWLKVTPITGGVAGATEVTFTVTAVAPCGNYLPGSSNAGSIHLRNLPAPDGLIPVTLRIVGPSPLVATPTAPSLAYTKGSVAPAFVDVAVGTAASNALSFAVASTSMPAWLSVDVPTGTGPQTLRFSTTTVADAVAQGTYSATVRVGVSGYADLALPFNLTVSNPSPKLTVTEGNSRDLSWTVGQPMPISYITLASSGSAIPYTLATGGPLAPIVGPSFLKGLALDHGTLIPVTFDPYVVAAAQSGTVLAGTVTINWGTPVTKTVVTLNMTVQPIDATLFGVTPRSLPAAAAGQTFTVALTGIGFVPGSDPAQRTVVGMVSGGALVADANIVSSVVNASNIILTITVPVAPDPFLPFAPTGAGGTVNLGVCNPKGTSCSNPTGTAQFAIGISPLILALTSASSFVQMTPPLLPTVAPYDMVSLFGINFCTAGGTGCETGILYGMLDPATLRYPNVLSPDLSGSGQRHLTVTFQTHATAPLPIATAPLLFATAGQINLLVPAAVTPFIGKVVDIVVNFGAGGAMVNSAPFSVSVMAANPGIFTVGGDGQGEGAVLDLGWNMVTHGNEAGLRLDPADSDTVQIYLTGLGAPDGAADNATAGSGTWPADCVTVASYLMSLNNMTSGNFPSVDGALLASGLLNSGRLVPCLRSAGSIPTVTVGGQPATVTYAGWVADSVAGQYQLNVRLPGSAVHPFTSASGDVIPTPLTAPVQLPVVVTARGRASQAGVTIWVAPRLKVTGPTSAALRGTVLAAWAVTDNLVTATGGTAPYQYALSGEALPAGLALNPLTGAISGTLAANTGGEYVLTVTATDSAVIPLTGSATFTLTVDGGLAPSIAAR